MIRVLGPWVGMTLEQAKVFILRAALAFTLRNGGWPNKWLGVDLLLNGASWSAANSWLKTQGTSLAALLLKRERQSSEALALAIVAFHKRHGAWPRSSSKDKEESRLGKTLVSLRHRKPDICLRHGIPLKSRQDNYLDSLAKEICAFHVRRERWPVAGATDPDERCLGRALSNLRQKHPDVCARHSIPTRSRPDDYHDTIAREILAFHEAHRGRWPRKGSADREERRLGVALEGLRRNHPVVCLRHDIPLKADLGQAIRQRHDREQFTNLGTLAPRLCRNHCATRLRPDIEGESWAALNTVLANAHTKPTASRGLGYALDLCQVNSICRFKTETIADCWRFTLKGAKRHDKRPWAAILASGDNKKIESAERIAFLDWENPDADGKPVRRPWSPPATQPEAGKPAPAKGKGKRAGAKA